MNVVDPVDRLTRQTAVVDVAVDRLESSAFTSQLMALVAWEHVQGVLADFDGDFARAPEQLQGL